MNRIALRLMLACSLVSLLALSFFTLSAQETDPNRPTGFATNTPMGQTAAPLAATPEAAAVTAVDTNETQPAVLEYSAACAYDGQPTNDDCRVFIAANPEPNVDQIPLDGATLSEFNFWRVGPNAVTTYDAPNGNPIGQIPQGFNFVTAVQQVEGWIQDEEGQWIRQSDGYYVPASNFAGVRLPEDWSLPFGYILDTTGIYASTYPGGPSDEASGLVPLRYEMYNIYAEAEDDEGWIWYLVGPDQWVKQIYMTVIHTVERPEGVEGRWVAVDLYEQSLIAYDGDQPVYATLISTGLPQWGTNEGVFEVWARLDSDPMSGATGAPNAYALQRVPWVQYFDGGISLHGTYWHDLFGYRRSRGCVNLTISDARFVYEFFGADGDEDPNYVYVHSSGEYRRG